MKKAFFATVIILIIAAASLLTLRWYLKDKYKDIVLNYIMDEISSRLVARVDVGNFDFEIFAKFPYASVVFEDLFCDGAPINNRSSDTLFYFNKLYLHLNILDILNGNYQIQKIEIEQGFFDAYIYSETQANYKIFKNQPGKDNDVFILSLDEVSLTKVALGFYDLPNHVKFSSDCYKAVFSGQFFENDIDIDTKFKGFIQMLQINQNDFILQRDVDLALNLEVRDNFNTFTFSRSNLTFDKQLNFSLAGSFTQKDVNLKINGNKLNIAAFMRLLPRNWVSEFDNISGKGIVAFQSEISGSIEGNNTPLVKAEFEIENGTLTNNDNGYRLNKLSFDGSFISPANHSGPVQLRLNNIEGYLMNNPFEGNFEIVDLENPFISGAVKGNFDATNFKFFLDLENLEIHNGNIEFAGEFKFPFNTKTGLNLQKKEQLYLNLSLNFSNLGFLEKTSDYSFKNLSGELLFNNEKVKFNNLSGKAQNAQVQLNGRVEHWLDAISDSIKGFEVYAGGWIDDLNIEDWLIKDNANSSNKEEEHFFPERHFYFAEVQIENLKYKSFQAKNVFTGITFSNKGLKFAGLSGDAFDGKIVGNALLNRASDNYKFLINAVIDEADIKQLFAQTNNFGQDFIQERHLEGRTSGKIKFQSLVDLQLNLLPESIQSYSTVSIENGRLIAYEPMQEIANYFRDNLVLRKIFKPDLMAEKLNDISFSKLENEIRVSDNKVIVPEMTISSSFLDLNLSGEHNFDNSFEYGFNFNISDILTENNAPKSNDFGELVTESKKGRLVFLKIYGNIDDFSVALDKKADKSYRKQERIEEKEVLKQMIKEEFGTVNPEPKEQNSKYQITFEEGEDEENQQEEIRKPVNKTKQEEENAGESKGIKGFLKKIAGEDEEKPKKQAIEFDEDF